MIYSLPDFPSTAWRGVFRWWRELVEPITVCPIPYHYANLLAILSSQLGDFAVLDEGVKTFLNFYVFCYGRTGTKKSTAMDLAHEWIVEKLNPRYFKPLSSISSAEGLIRTLATPPNNVLLHYDEVKHLFSVASRSGSAIEPVLNKAFGLGPVETCVRSASDSLAGVNYFFNMVCNGTPIHITMDVGEAMFFGGLINRFLVFAAVPNDRIMAQMGCPDEERIEEFCSRINQHISAWRGFAQTRASVRVKLSQEAIDVFMPWYTKMELAGRVENELESDPIQRISLYTKKLAAVYCLWETPEPCARPVVTAEQMQAAIDVTDYCQASIMFMSSAWGGSKTLGSRADALAEKRVEGYLQKHGCSTERTLAHAMGMGISEAKRAITALESVNSVLLSPGTAGRLVHWRDACKCFGTALPGEPPVAPPPVEKPSFETSEYPPMYEPDEL